MQPKNVPKTPEKLFNTVVIEGTTVDGKPFRPSDWAERLSHSLATFANGRVVYSPLLKPAQHNNESCVLINKELRATNPELFEQILAFAKANNLKICD